THGHGFDAARLDLFTGAVVYVTPTRDGDGAAREIAHFWEDVLETHPVLIDAAQHDRQLALTSHLPQAVASLLARYLARATPPGATFGPGARDATRLAASEPALWTEIFLMNRADLLPALRPLEAPLGELERAREAGEHAGVAGRLPRAACSASPPLSGSRPRSPATPRCGAGRCGASPSRCAPWAHASTTRTATRCRSRSAAGGCTRSPTRPPSPARR